MRTKGSIKLRRVVSEAHGRLDLYAAQGRPSPVGPDPARVDHAAAARPCQSEGRPSSSGEMWEDWDLVWCGSRGQPIDAHDDWEEWQALLKEAGRTTRVTLPGRCSGEQHVDLHVIQRILGRAQFARPSTRRGNDDR